MSAALNSRRVGMDLTEGSIFKCLTVFASPIVLAALIQQLYSVADLAIIGKYMGNLGTVGVSLGGEVSDMVTPVATAFSTAGQIYIAQLIGARKTEGVKSAIGTLLTMMALLSLALAAVSLIFCRGILGLLNCPEDALQQAVNYQVITAIGIPFIYGYNAVCGILRGMGESKAPMIFIIIAAVVNILLDLIFVMVFQWEAAGTAIATVVAQLASFLAAWLFMLRHKEQFGVELTPGCFKIDKEDAGVILRVGVPQAIRSSLVRLSMFWVNSQVNAYGMVVSSTNSIGNKMQKFLDIFSASYAQASAAIIGQSLGAGKKERAGKVVWGTLVYCLAIASVISALTVIFPRFTFGVFTNDEGVLAMAPLYLRILVAHFIWSAVVSAFQSIVIGSGYASMNFVIGILDGIVCKIGLGCLFAYVMKMDAVGFFLGTAWSRALPALICFIYFMSGKWKTRRLLLDKKR